MIASLALGLVLAHRSSGVVNLAHGAMGVYVAFAFFEFRETGDLVLPFLGLPARVHLLARPTLASALGLAAALAVLLGLIVYALVFRPLRRSPALAKVVASLGLLLYLQEVVRLRFPVSGASVVVRRPVLPEDPVRVLDAVVTENRLLLALLAVLVTGVLAAVFRWTRWGLAVRAADENEKGALLVGLSPDRLGAAAWAIASLLAGFAVILIEPIAGISPTTTSLLVIPALAAALAGRLESFAATTAAGLGIGMVQSWVLGYAVRPEVTWIPSWVPTTGLQSVVPVVVIVAVLFRRGEVLPDRAALIGRRLPAAPEPRHVAAWTVGLVAVTSVALLTVDAAHRHALIVSLLAALLSLSIVVVTGFTGQISLAQLAFAGVAGFAAIRLADRGVPFPLAVVLAAVLAAALGVVVGFPATRVRGMTLAVATLAIAVAVEELVLDSSAVSGGPAGRSAPRPFLLGIDVGVGARGAANFRPAFGFVCLGVLALSAVAVANLRRSETGRRWLAVRANERAAAAAGVDVARAKLAAFAVSSFLVGLAGCLLAYERQNLSVSSFTVFQSLGYLAVTYIGGVASIAGALLAGALTQGGLVTQATGGDSTSQYQFALNGVVLIVVAIVYQDGLSGAVERLWAKLRRRRPGS